MSDSNSFKDHRSTDYNEVLLCDINGNYKSTKDKLQAHLDGDLHIAFSVQLVRPSRVNKMGLSYYYKDVPKVNTIRKDYGLTHVVHIHSSMSHLK